MPITNGKYVAPTWTNGGGTPISAANLQDISNALAWSGRIAIGSYTGTGSNNSVQIKFSFIPRLVIIFGPGTDDIPPAVFDTSQENQIVYQPYDSVVIFITGFSSSTKTFSFNGAQVWTPDSAGPDSPPQKRRYNATGKKYTYIAIG